MNNFKKILKDNLNESSEDNNFINFTGIDGNKVEFNASYKRFHSDFKSKTDFYDYYDLDNPKEVAKKRKLLLKKSNDEVKSLLDNVDKKIEKVIKKLIQDIDSM